MQENDKSVPTNESQTSEVASPVVMPLAEQKMGSSFGAIVLQWLTYTFWGWTILLLLLLMYIVIANYISDKDLHSTTPYILAAALVLLPLSVICDIVYSRIEPTKKHGITKVVMVIHAVIFALFGIGMLILAVLNIVQLTIHPSLSSSGFPAMTITLFIISGVYAFTFLRTLNTTAFLRIRYIYPLVMGVLGGVFIVMGFNGPVESIAMAKNDRVVEDNLNNIIFEVGSYTKINKKLPAAISDVELSNDAKALVDKGTVTYVEDGPATGTAILPTSIKSSAETPGIEYRYQLCAEYVKKGESPIFDDTPREYTEYKSAIYTPGHPAGRVCYKIKYDPTATY